jgi:small subunit ribosomal protein S16
MLKIRLRRMGKTHAPFYRVVVSDSRRTPTASAVEEVGHYNPRPTPPEVRLDLPRVRYWVDQGALLSPTVKKLVQKAEAAPEPAAEAVEKPAKKAGGAKSEAKTEAKPAAEAKAPAAEAKSATEAEAAAEEAPAAEAAAGETAAETASDETETSG